MESYAGVPAIVTGAASGIGFAFTRQLLAEGARVVMADVEAGALEAAAAQARELGDVLLVVVDVRDPVAVDDLAARAADAFGTTQLVFANAGVSQSGALWEVTADDWRWLLGVNVLGVANTVRSFVRPLVDAGLPGHVCMTSSIAGYLNQPGYGAYNATKHAVVAIAETLAADVREAGLPIGVTLLAPWFVRTNLPQASRNRPADLADAAPRSALVDQVLAQLGGWSATTQGPDEVAALTVAAMHAGRFGVFPYEPSTDAMRRRIDTVIAGGVMDMYLPE
jgi:NAD(P)-dependent dehydrogenase (short-subunit alcohol dehydrogenase family)